MCYSAQVLRQAKKMARDLGALLDYAEFEKLFVQRLDDPALVISRGLEANFEEPTYDPERRIKAAIDAHRSRAATSSRSEFPAEMPSDYGDPSVSPRSSLPWTVSMR